MVPPARDLLLSSITRGNSLFDEDKTMKKTPIKHESPNKRDAASTLAVKIRRIRTGVQAGAAGGSPKDFCQASCGNLTRS